MNLINIKKYMHLNDSLRVVYTLIMLLFLVSPTLFFDQTVEFYRSMIMVYIVSVIALWRYVPGRVILHKHILTYIVIGVISYLIFRSLVVVSPSDITMFKSIFSVWLWYIFVVGVTETYLMLGLENMTKNRGIAIIVMGLFHITSYMYMLGKFNFDIGLLKLILKSMLGFFLFFKIYDLTKDPFAVALVHGIYDLVLIGG